VSALQLFRMTNQFWDLVQTFFEAATTFAEIYDSYEARVLAHADAAGVDRRLLRLSGKEVADLLEFDRLVELCDRHLVALKTIAQGIFRSSRSTDAFDRYATQIYHETSILKEEQYKVFRIAPAYQDTKDRKAYQTIIDEAHEAFPRQIHLIHELMAQALGRLEELLPHFQRDRVMLRSTYLFGDETFDVYYPNGYEDAFDRMFPREGGARKGLLEVARSFVLAGFRGQALEALKVAQGLPTPSGSPEETAQAAALATEIEELVEELKTRPPRKPRALASSSEDREPV